MLSGVRDDWWLVAGVGGCGPRHRGAGPLCVQRHPRQEDHWGHTTLVCQLLLHTVTYFRWMKKLQIFSSRTKWCINFYQNYQQVDLWTRNTEFSITNTSSGSESDPLTVLNMVMMTAFNKVKSQPSFVSYHIDTLQLFLVYHYFRWKEVLCCLCWNPLEDQVQLWMWQ